MTFIFGVGDAVKAIVADPVGNNIYFLTGRGNFMVTNTDGSRKARLEFYTGSDTANMDFDVRKR